MKTGTAIILILLICVPLCASDKPVKFTLSVVAVGLSIADTATTIYGTKRGLIETNGLMRGFVERRQYWALWASQGVGVAVLLGGAYLLIGQNSRPAKIAGYAILIGTILVKGYIVWHNARLNRGL